MGIPVDEMITELRFTLEAFDSEPCPRTLDAVLEETTRIAVTCETEWVEMDGEEGGAE